MSRQPAECVLPRTPSGHLDLQKPADRRRLADELVRVDAIAAHYREVIRGYPPGSDSVDTMRNYAGRPDRAYRYCREVLRQQLADAYGVDLSQFLDGDLGDGS